MKYLKRAVFLFVTVLLACSSPSMKSSEGNSEEEFREFWNPKMDASTKETDRPNPRLRVENKSLIFEGHIIENDCQKFRKILKGKDLDEVIVNSQGGSVHEAICISNLLKSSGINKTIVRGLCWSSCANYLFLGSDARVVERGTVGFHGNIHALLKVHNTVEPLRKFAKKEVLTPSDVQKLRDHLGIKRKGNLTKDEKAAIQLTWETYILEDEFMKNRKVPQELFDLTQKSDKGEGNGKIYQFMFPESRFSERFGISYIGKQDVEFINKINPHFPVGLLYKN